VAVVVALTLSLDEMVDQGVEQIRLIQDTEQARLGRATTGGHQVLRGAVVVAVGLGLLVEMLSAPQHTLLALVAMDCKAQ